MPLQVLHQVYAACAATAWGLMKFSVPANAIAKWTCSANNRHTKGAKRGREEGEGRDARLKGANVNMNACPAASNISSAIGIQSKLLINMCAAWPRPRPAPAPAPDHGQANAKMTACCCCCCCNSVGVHGSGWRGACLASTVKEQWARGIAWPLDCRQMQCIHGKKFPPPPPPSLPSPLQRSRTFGNHWNSHIKEEGTESESCQFASCGSGQLDSMDYLNILLCFHCVALYPTATGLWQTYSSWHFRPHKVEINICASVWTRLTRRVDELGLWNLMTVCIISGVN